MQTGNLDKNKRKQIEEFQAIHKAKETEVWNIASNTNTIESYKEYLAKYPNGSYVDNARTMISAIKQEEEKDCEKRLEIIRSISNNPNDYTTTQIKNLINAKTITRSDLLESGIPLGIIDAVYTYPDTYNLDIGSTPQQIPTGYTEVYFWGDPGSGKTCAISGILSKAERMGILDTHAGPGYGYMNQLKNIFTNTIGYLPNFGTADDVTQCLQFDLKDEEGKKHPITFIELSGEIFKFYYYRLIKKSMNPEREETFRKLTRLMNSSNRKVHFFVFDLQKDPMKVDSLGLRQHDYLDAAQKYFKETNIFKESTDAIYIIATKSDLLDCNVDQRADAARDLLREHYPSFVDVLKDACKSFKINDNRDLRVVPFTLGDVYFNFLCKFNDRSSLEIIRTLQQKTAIRTNISWLRNKFNE